VLPLLETPSPQLIQRLRLQGLGDEAVGEGGVDGDEGRPVGRLDEGGAPLGLSKRRRHVSQPEATPRHQELVQPSRVGQVGDGPPPAPKPGVDDEAVGPLEEAGFP